MATILLSSAGAAIGGSLGGTFAGLSSVVVGRAVGATLGRVLDQKLMGQGAGAVETGKVDRFRLTNAGEGNPISRVFGRMRVGGQVIWASDFYETSTTTGGGKGAPSGPAVTDYAYTVSLAVALCEGEINGIARVWADGEIVPLQRLNMSVYSGSQSQLPDPVMEAIEGAGQVPAYRGTAYVVFDNLPLAQFGNRVPQFSFEVLRGAQPDAPDYDTSLAQAVTAVACIPGTGEYALATTPAYYSAAPDTNSVANINTPSEHTDFATAVQGLQTELPNAQAVSLVVSWFGDDLRCGQCQIKPKVEQAEFDAQSLPWSVSGLSRAEADVIAQREGRPVYGGTPTDQSVIEAIISLKDNGQRVLFYPFILMEQMDGNDLTNPWTGAAPQPTLPWRGRITSSLAPDQEGAPDGTQAAADEVAAFFGSVTAQDFQVAEGGVTYTGPEEWSFSRHILHCAALCAASGGVDAFCIGSEMRGLTQIRGPNNTFPAVARLKELASEARALLGADCKVSYAADWSEYFGYQPQDGSNDRLFHLDPLWADPNIDFIAIDNYMPLSDWRDDADHMDGEARSLYDLDYLKSNVAGGEGYDWFYASDTARAAQSRSAIEDAEHNEPWIWRYKDLRAWWSNPHHDRVGGVRLASPSAWVPQSKPFWFTELGCAAVDKATNQPNRFVDLNSSESGVPHFSNGQRDELIQTKYLEAMFGYWRDAANNPTSDIYAAPMVDMDNAYVWAWDARPYPYFPNAQSTWSDGQNYRLGHWINGRTASRTLASVVEEICRTSGLSQVDTKDLHGYVRGYVLNDVTDARAALQPLMLKYGFDASERLGTLKFANRPAQEAHQLSMEHLALIDGADGAIEHARDPEAEMAGRVRLQFVEADADFGTISEEAVMPEQQTHAISTSSISLCLTRAEGRQTVERWLTEARVARETVTFALPPSQMGIGVGDVVHMTDVGNAAQASYRVDRVEMADALSVEAVRIDPGVYLPASVAEDTASTAPFLAPTPVSAYVLDIPNLSDSSITSPYLAVSGSPWPGAVAVYASSSDAGYDLVQTVAKASVSGRTQTDLALGPLGLWDHSSALRVKLATGALSTRSAQDVLAGANTAAIGDGTSSGWEVIQFQNAHLVGDSLWELSGLLRGQMGSDAMMPAVWPAGARFVMLNPAPDVLNHPPALNGLARHYRIGPARQSYDHPSFIYRNEVITGEGLRPYKPSHLTLNALNGDTQLSWMRRTRIGGDSWMTPEVPLGEDTEQYAVRVVQDGIILRDAVTADATWTYSAQQKSNDGVDATARFEVAQVSAIYGIGPYASISLV